MVGISRGFEGSVGVDDGILGGFNELKTGEGSIQYVTALYNNSATVQYYSSTIGRTVDFLLNFSPEIYY